MRFVHNVIDRFIQHLIRAVSVNSQGLIIEMDHQHHSQMVRIANALNWTLLHQPRAGQVFRRMHESDVRIVLIEVPSRPMLDQSLELIKKLRDHWHPFFIIAASFTGNAEREKLSRLAGCCCFLNVPVSASADAWIVDQVRQTQHQLELVMHSRLNRSGRTERFDLPALNLDDVSSFNNTGGIK